MALTAFNFDITAHNCPKCNNTTSSTRTRWTSFVSFIRMESAVRTKVVASFESVQLNKACLTSNADFLLAVTITSVAGLNIFFIAVVFPHPATPSTKLIVPVGARYWSVVSARHLLFEITQSALTI
nr:hypothetical 13.7K protein - tomato aspermy virus [Tomato aspermy virus]